MARKKAEVDVEAPRAKGPDGLLTVSIETTDGTVTRSYRVAGYLGNTLPWQRVGKGVDDMLIPGLLKAFGGQVTPA